PDYMVPAVFVFLPELPRLANGKINRKALPAPQPDRAEVNGARDLPRDRLEHQLTQVWADVLSRHPIGIRDHFFDLGGHSWLGVRLMARIEQQFGQKLPLSILFQQGTVEALADLLRRQVEPASESPLVEIQRHGSRPPFFCVHPAGGNVFCYAPLSHHLGREQPFYGLKAPVVNGDQDAYERLEDMARHYVELMRSVQPIGPYYLGGWRTGGMVAFEMARQLREQGHEVALLALLETDFPQADRPVREVDPAKLLVMFAKKRGVEVTPEELAGRSPDVQLSYVIERAKAAGLS